MFVATGANFPDALVAGPVANNLNRSLLLVSRDSIPPEVITELQRLGPATITVIGGTSAISETVRAQLSSYAYNPVARLAGTDRFDTGWQVLSEAFAGYSGPVFIATGLDFPDALAGGPAAAQFAAPIVLATRDSLPLKSQYALLGMAPSKFVLLGGAGVLSSILVHQLQTLMPGVPIERWSGADQIGRAHV